MQTLRKWNAALTERGKLSILLVMSFGLLTYILTNLHYLFSLIVLLPWAMGLAYRNIRSGGLKGSFPLQALTASMAVYCATALLSGTVTPVWTCQAWLLMACIYCLLMVPGDTGLHAQRTELRSMGLVMICGYLPFMLTAMVSVFTGWVIHLPSINQPVGIQAPWCISDRIRIFTNPNISARFAACCALFALYVFITAKSRRMRIFMALAAVINIMVLAHSQSRTCTIAFSVAAAALAFRFVWLRMEGNRWRLIVGALTMTAVFFIVHEAVGLLFQADVAVSRLFLTEEQRALSAAGRLNGDFDVLDNGRGAIWSAALKYLLQNPRVLITGLGAVDFMEVISTIDPEVAIYANLHCSYLACIFQCGLPYLLCVLAFMASLVGPAVRLLLRREDEETRGLFVLPVFVGMLVVMSLPEQLLFVSQFMSNLLFFFLSGHLLHADRLIRAGAHTGEVRR